MIIPTQTIVINGIEYDYHISPNGMKIECDGVPYDEAIDPLNSGRVYYETDIPIENDNITLDEYNDAKQTVSDYENQIKTPFDEEVTADAES